MSPGPMVLAAWLRRIPAALTEADAHLGLANRLAAPFARRVFLAYEIDGPQRAEVPRRRPADPAAHLGATGRKGGGVSGSRSTGRSWPSSGHSQVPARSTSSRRRPGARAGPPCSTSAASATTSCCASG